MHLPCWRAAHKLPAVCPMGSMHPISWNFPESRYLYAEGVAVVCSDPALLWALCVLRLRPAISIGLPGGVGEVGILSLWVVARTTTLDKLRIGYNQQKHPEQAAMLTLIPLLAALTPDASSSAGSQSQVSGANRSITKLSLGVIGLPGAKDSAVEAAGLAEAVTAMLASNTTLEFLIVSSFFVTRGLWALPQNSGITTLELVHHYSLKEEKLDPLLLSIMEECTKLQVLQLTFRRPYGPSNFTKELFQGLKHNKPPVKRLVLDGWHGLGWAGLDDHMSQDLIQSLSTNTSLNHISIKGSSWEKQGKGQRLAKALRDTRVKPLPPRLLALLAELESEPPALQQLPSEDLWGSYFDCQCLDGECQHRGEWQRDLRLHLLTAVGKCRTLRQIQLSPLLRVGHSVRRWRSYQACKTTLCCRSWICVATWALGPQQPACGHWLPSY